MATLAANVNSTEQLWTVSESIPDGLRYFTVGDEIVEVIADFPAQIYAPTGLTTAPKIRVDRGVAGSTAAAHLSGVTLTPIYSPSVGGGPAGALTVTDGVTSVEASTLSLTGAAVTDEGAGVAGADTGIPDPINGDENDVLQIVGGAYSLGPFDHDSIDHAPVFPIDVSASGGANADAAVRADAVDGAAQAGAEATATGIGTAYVSIGATSTTGTADVGVGAQSTEGDVSLSLRAIQDAAQAGFIISVTGAGVEQILALGLPTSNPNVAGALWNDTGTLKVSAG